MTKARRDERRGDATSQAKPSQAQHNKPNRDAKTDKTQNTQRSKQQTNQPTTQNKAKARKTEKKNPVTARVYLPCPAASGAACTPSRTPPSACKESRGSRAKKIPATKKRKQHPTEENEQRAKGRYSDSSGNKRNEIMARVHTSAERDRTQEMCWFGPEDQTWYVYDVS